MQAQKLLAVVTVEFGGRVVDFDEAQVFAVQREHGERRSAEQRAEEWILHDSSLGRPAVRRLAEHGHKIAILQRSHADVHAEVGAVAARHLAFAADSLTLDVAQIAHRQEAPGVLTDHDVARHAKHIA